MRNPSEIDGYKTFQEGSTPDRVQREQEGYLMDIEPEIEISKNEELKEWFKRQEENVGRGGVIDWNSLKELIKNDSELKERLSKICPEFSKALSQKSSPVTHEELGNSIRDQLGVIDGGKDPNIALRGNVFFHSVDRALRKTG